MSLAPGDYEFSATADDGVRLYVDGDRVIDKWIDQGPTTYRATLPLDGSPHKIVMEYYENGGGATAKLNYRRVGDPPAEAPWRGQYWNTPDATGVPSMPTGPADLERDDETLDFDWGEGSPGAGIAADRFVARWTKTVVLSAGVYRFSGARDDGMRVYVDDVPVADKWTFGNEEYSVDKVLAGGAHEIRVDHFEGGSGARAKFSYDRIGDVGSADGGWAAEYFANRNLTGSPVLTRTDDAIDFDWGDGSPGDGVPADNFSTRWMKSLTVEEASSYKFTVTGDDGVRLYIDGERVLDKWVQQGATAYTVVHHLTQGTHQVVLEYFDAGAGAVAKLRYEKTSETPPPPPPAEPYAAEYFGNRDLAGTPVLTRTDNRIDFNWGGDGPGSGVPVDNFSARWTRSVTLDEEDAYKFTVTGDDGVRLFVDGEKVLDKWFQQGATTHTVTRSLTQGAHQIVLEYFEANGDAVAKLSFDKTSDPPPEPFAAEYFDNSSLSGEPVLTRSDAAIDFDWGAGAPSFAVPFDRFSTRWTRTKAYSAGTYRFTVTGDDGIRVLVDGTPVVDGWAYQAPTTYTADVPLPEGEHTVVVEYFEHTGRRGRQVQRVEADRTLGRTAGLSHRSATQLCTVELHRPCKAVLERCAGPPADRRGGRGIGDAHTLELSIGEGAEARLDGSPDKALQLRHERTHADEGARPDVDRSTVSARRDSCRQESIDDIIDIDPVHPAVTAHELRRLATQQRRRDVGNELPQVALPRPVDHENAEVHD